MKSLYESILNVDTKSVTNDVQKLLDIKQEILEIIKICKFDDMNAQYLSQSTSYLLGRNGSSVPCYCWDKRQIPSKKYEEMLKKSISYKFKTNCSILDESEGKRGYAVFQWDDKHEIWFSISRYKISTSWVTRMSFSPVVKDMLQNR